MVMMITCDCTAVICLLLMTIISNSLQDDGLHDSINNYHIKQHPLELYFTLSLSFALIRSFNTTDHFIIAPCQFHFYQLYDERTIILILFFNISCRKSTDNRMSCKLITFISLCAQLISILCPMSS